MEELDGVEALLAGDADGPAARDGLRPPGAPDPVEPPGLESEFEAEGAADADSIETEPISAGKAARLASRAKRQEERGNVVGAAVHWARSARLSDPANADHAYAEAASALDRLTRRLQEALFLRADQADEWAEALTPLLNRASRGFWTNEARLLYDLQTVCLDHERETYRLDLLGWAATLGRRPLKNPLPHLREVAMSNHLRGAARRLGKIKLSKADRLRLDGLLRPAVHRAEDALRERFQPWIDATLRAQWVQPRNLPERVAYAKLVEELLDQVVRNGYTSLGDLRDAASRNQVKLPDVSGPAEFLQGGRLLKTDRALAQALDGVHRRGEVYLRWLQRFSALCSGTRKGRWFSLYVALPFGGSYVLLEGLQHLIGAIEKFASSVSHWFGGSSAPHPASPEMVFELANPWSVLICGSIALGVINWCGWPGCCF
jgi:hypothetical protein